MQPRIIRLCYRKIIDKHSTRQWEKLVFESSYNEFRMQASLFNQEGKYDSFAALKQHVPQSEQLHFLVSTSIMGYMQQLNGKIPDVANNLGEQVLTFNEYRFEIINSSVYSINDHQVAIRFYSDPLLWIDSVGENLLIANMPLEETKDGIITSLLALKPYLSIYSVKEQA